MCSVDAAGPALSQGCCVCGPVCQSSCLPGARLDLQHVLTRTVPAHMPAQKLLRSNSMVEHWWMLLPFFIWAVLLMAFYIMTILW